VHLSVAARQTMRAIEPNLAITEASSMQETAAESVASTRLALWLLGVFAIVALALAAIGIYGVTSYVVRQRTREIGTRLALGARPGDILWLIVRGGGMLGLIGVALGLGAGLLAARSLTSILYGVSTWDPRTMTTAAVALITTALLASYLPARRASRTDPARTLTGN
jgi:putative ABC transport system permease protein